MPKRRLERDYHSESALASGVVAFKDTVTEKAYTFDTTKIFPTFGEFNAIQKKMVLMAVNNVLGDTAADKEKDAIEAITARGVKLLAGEWSGRGSGGSGPRMTVLAEAVAAVKGMEIEDVIAKLETMDDETKKKLKAHPAVAAKMAEITAKRAAEKAKKAKGDAKEAGELDF